MQLGKLRPRTATRSSGRVVTYYEVEITWKVGDRVVTRVYHNLNRCWVTDRTSEDTDWKPGVTEMELPFFHIRERLQAKVAAHEKAAEQKIAA